MSISIVSDRDLRFTAHFLEGFPASHGDTVDDEHNFSSPDGRVMSVKLIYVLSLFHMLF